jgi:leader peptidase (prepilin peptidase) / N-methyltransferase
LDLWSALDLWALAAWALAAPAGWLVASQRAAWREPAAAPSAQAIWLTSAACLMIAAMADGQMGGWLALATALMGWTLLLSSLVDVDSFWLPDSLTLLVLAGGLAVNAALDVSSIPAHLIGIVVGFVSLWLVNAAYKAWRSVDGLGGGDAKLLAAAGAWTGWAYLPTVVLWAVALALLSVVYLRLRGDSLSGQTALPFGPALAGGLWLTWLYGPLTMLA